MRPTHTDLAILRTLALEAGAAIMKIYEKDAIAVTAKADHSPVTEADLAADAVIRAGLAKHFPDIAVLSEESPDALPRDTALFFLVDPLDGTREFISRNGEFTVNIALIENGRSIAATVHAPAINATYIAAEGLGAWRHDENGTALALKTHLHTEGEPLRVLASRSHNSPETETFIARLPAPVTLIQSGSSLKFCTVASGAGDLYPRFGPTSQWDTAAGQCILEQAGGLVLTAEGEPLRYGLDLPLLNPSFIALATPALRSVAGI